MKSGKNGKKNAIIVLSVLLVITIILGIIGVTGLALPPRGLRKVLSWLPTTDAENWPQSLPLGLDLRGGLYVEYSTKAPEGSEADFEALRNGTIGIITQRLSDKGFTECNVQPIGLDGLRVEIPTKEEVDSDSVLDLIGAAAKLEFLDPDGNVFMTGDMVKTASYFYDEGDHQIAFTLTDEGTKVFGDMTAKSIGKTIAIMLDGEQLIAPTVQSAINEGRGVINNLGSADRASTIAAKIQSGALPLELTQQKVDKVSATLGKDALSTSILAAIIGIALVMVLMIIRYRLNGLMASWALALYIIVLFLLIALFKIQLTLPGLAGVVLGIGMAVDANVIIFERFNEEIRAGKTLKASVRGGFKNAMSAILDSNITTLIAAIVLLIFGTGSIQGFAKTLLLGVLVSMFTAIVITRVLVNNITKLVPSIPCYTKVANDSEKEVDA